MFYLIIATICFSVSFGLIKEQLSVLPSEFVVVCRLLIAFLLFLPCIRKINYKKALLVVCVGAIQFGVMYLCFIKAFKYLQGNEVALLTTTTPIFVGIISSLLGEKIKPIYVICVLMSVIGGVVILWHSIPLVWIIKGIALMECSNASFALGQVLWKKYINDNDLRLMPLAYLGALIITLPILFFNVDIANCVLSKYQMLALLYLGTIPTGVGFWLWNKGAKCVKYTMLAVMNNLKIPVSILVAIFIFKEDINFFYYIIGLIFIISSILIMFRETSK
ncbi:MAG: EamA family transporter [bacterium]|nr:EamA family transporter [bacterium]